MTSSQGTSMVVVPASFLSQEWADHLTMKPSQRHFNPVVTGQHLYDTLVKPNADDVTKRSNFFDELGDFNDYNQQHLSKPPALRLKGNATHKKSKTCKRNCTGFDRSYRGTTTTTTTTATTPPTSTSTNLLLCHDINPPRPTSSPAFVAELTEAVQKPRLKPTPKHSKMKKYSSSDAVTKLFAAVKFSTPEAIGERTRSKAKQQKGHGYKRKGTFQYVSFNKHKRARRVHMV